MTSNLLGKRRFPTQHVPHDLAGKTYVKLSSLCALREGMPYISIMVYFQMEENLKEAVVKPVLLSSSSTSLLIRSLNEVGDCVLLCGGRRTLCLA